MKTNKFLLYIIAQLISINLFCQSVDVNYELRKEYYSCDSIMNAKYKILLDLYSDNEPLKKSQSTWVDYINTECSFRYPYSGKLINETCSLNFKIFETNDRIRLLDILISNVDEEYICLETY